MKRFSYATAGVALGASLAYFIDPRRGRRRRHELKMKAGHAMKEAAGTAELVAKDASNRSRGLVHKLASRLVDAPVDDSVLVARVRARLGRVTSHPHAVCVEAKDGVVELTGEVLASELGELLASIAQVDGVKAVVHKLEPHLGADTPSLQGGIAPASRGRDELWSPTLRAAAGAGGGLALFFAMTKRGPVGIVAGASGALLVARAVTNTPLPNLLGLGDGREIVVRKSIHLRAPVEDAYGYFRAFENFPRFMRHVREVKEHHHGRIEWKVDGPLGLPVRFCSRLVEETPNDRLSWEATEDSALKSRGTVRFEPELSGGTLVELRLSWCPPFGLLGQLASRILRADPKRELDDDLLRLKSLLEHGKASGRAGAVMLDELPLPPSGAPRTVH